MKYCWPMYSRVKSQRAQISIRYQRHPVLANKSFNAPTSTCVKIDDRGKVSNSILADVKDFPDSYVIITDMSGLKLGDIKVQLENDNMLVITGEWKKDEDKKGTKPVIMERRVGKFTRKFLVPANANKDAISAVFQDGVLTVTMQKLPLTQFKHRKTIEVKTA